MANSGHVPAQRAAASGAACPHPTRVILLSAFALVASPASAQYGPGGLVPPPTSDASSSSFGGFKDSIIAAGGKRGWTVQPLLAVEETYTDNVRLAPSGSERSDWVTSVRPGVAVNGVGARTRLSATYTPQFIYRANEQSQDVLHYLNAIGKAELWQDLLFVDATASISQQNVSLGGPQAQSNINDTGNRTSVKTYSVSPYLRRALGYEALGELRYTYSSVGYSGNSLASSDSNRIDARLYSGPAFRLTTWNLAYNKEHISYSQTGQSIDMQSASAGARRLLTPTLGVLANVGYEDNDYVTVGPAPKGSFWSVGPEWTPTPRTRLVATAGRRYYGPTHSLDFSHRTRLTTWHLEYREEITTTRGQAFLPVAADTASLLDSLFRSSIPDPIARQTAVQSYISQTGLPPSLTVPLNYITLVPFLEKRWLGTVGIQGVRNSVFANVFVQKREATAPGQLAAGDLTLSPHTKQTGGTVLWTHRFTPQTSSSASVGYTRSEFSALAREDKLTYVRLALNRQFSPRVSGILSLRRLQNDSNQSGGTYRENAVSALVSIRF